jgi:acyl-coenzyme A thioesterase PaaI-like protein
MNLIDKPAASNSLESLLADGWKSADTPGFIELVGPILYKEDGGRLRLGFLAGPKHEKRRGVVQGGMIATFCDRSLGMASRRANNDGPQATIELSIRYIDAVQLGEFVEIVPEIVRKTRSIVFARGTATVGNRVVATADGIWKLLTEKGPAKG